jgi:hypothetical protein
LLAYWQQNVIVKMNLKTGKEKKSCSGKQIKFLAEKLGFDKLDRL